MKSDTFKRILAWNVGLPLVMSALLCAVFVSLLLNLLSLNKEQARTSAVRSQGYQTMKHVLDTETRLRGYLLYGTPQFRETYVRTVKNALPQIEQLEEVTEGPAQKTRVRKVSETFQAWLKLAEGVVKIQDQGTYRAGEDLLARRELMDSIRATLEDYLAQASLERENRVKETERNTTYALALVVILTLIAGVVLALTGRRQLMSLSEKYQESLDLQIEQNQALMHQAWLRSGQAQMSEAVKGDHSIEELSRRILTQISEYVGAAVGALYRIRDDGRLQLVSGVALAADTPSEFGPDEGIPGQVVARNSLVVVNPLPAGALRLVSGVSSSSLESLIACPLTADGVPQAVLELGFVGSFPPKARELLEQIGEIGGTALRSAVYRVKLQELLRRSQELAEELQTQQEELRVSNEELSERTQALQDTQSRLESQHAELEQTNEQLEEQAQTLEHQKKDLDERNQLLERIRQEVEDKARELGAASRYKSEFLANMSHELRTPLNSSLILAKLLMDNPDNNLSEEQVKFASTIYSAGNDLLNLINDILDLSKVEAGKLEITIEKTPVKALAQTIDRTFAVIAREKGLELKIEVGSDVPETIQTDRLRTEQILKNLVSNAMKFTSQGAVTLAVRRVEGERVAFDIRDTGVGIDPTQIDAIFEAFRQADGTINRRYGGTGLGLSISRNLAAILGGEIQVDSAPGKGSTFTLILPERLNEEAAATLRDLAAGPAKRMAAGASSSEKAVDEEAREPVVPLPLKRDREVFPEPAASASTAAQPLPPFPDDRENLRPGLKTLLIVEDDESFAKIVNDHAHEMGFQTIVASTSNAGYELATKFVPSAVVLDMKLPDASGLSFLDRLKGNPKTRHIPVHGMSANDYTQEVLHLGGIGHALKPVNREVLQQTLERIEKKIDQSVKRVLIVEDDPVHRMSIEKLISDEAIQLVSVGSGSEAIQRIAVESFDCMIMDLSLPDMSGFDLLENMSGHPEVSTPPVIVYTGRDLSKAEEQRLSRYSRSIIIKGARSPERLLDEVTLFLHSVEAELSPEHQKLLRSSRNRERAFEGRTVLIVDDDARNIFALSSALEQKGARVKIGRNGREALDRAQQHPEIDLILMDIMMPEMDGYEAIRQLRAKEAFKKIPIIAVTAKAMRDDYEMCLKVGANDYLSKPVDLDRLISLMRVWLPKQIGS